MKEKGILVFEQNFHRMRKNIEDLIKYEKINKRYHLDEIIDKLKTAISICGEDEIALCVLVNIEEFICIWIMLF